MKKIAVIGDVVSSTRIMDRGSFQGSLSAILNYLNHDETRIESRYIITLGDEFQALYSQADSLFIDALQILAHIDPVRVRFSFGIGSIETEINPLRAIGMDGPAFHEARRGIREIKKTRYLFNVRGLPPKSEPLVREAAMLISLLIGKWKRSRFDIFLGLHRGEPVAEIADHLGLTAQAVYKAIDSADMKIILQLTRSITSSINAGLREK